LRKKPRGLQSYGPAKISRRTLVFLIALRCYAIVAVVIAVYSFFRAAR
jgi:hypothetical protein